MANNAGVSGSSSSWVWGAEHNGTVLNIGGTGFPDFSVPTGMLLLGMDLVVVTEESNVIAMGCGLHSNASGVDVSLTTTVDVSETGTVTKSWRGQVPLTTTVYAKGRIQTSIDADMSITLWGVVVQGVTHTAQLVEM